MAEPEWSTDAALYELIGRELYTPVVGDILDEHGAVHQFLPSRCRSTGRAETTLIGRAMPMLYADVSGPQEQPFGLLTEALDQIGTGEVVLVCGGSKTYAVWGEILTATAKKRGAIGAVIDGYHRDTPRMLEQDWPVFSYGSYAQDAGVRGRVIDYRCRVEIGGVIVNPGDLVFGDVDGVVVVPRALEAVVISEALEKARGEKVVRREIENGMSSTEAFRKYGIL